MKPKWIGLWLLVFGLGNASAQVPQKAHWSSFRGDRAAGVAEGQSLPEKWDGAKGLNIKWKTRIPGLAHSSPIVWGDRVFVTTAISSKGGDSFRKGLYGDGDASDDRSSQQWKLYAIDKNSGKILWDRTAYDGEPVRSDTSRQAMRMQHRRPTVVT